MVFSSDVVRFRADGHTVAETMAHFSISERTVYNASARARRESVSIPVELPPASPAPIPADDLAGDNTYWKCPVSGDLIPVVPGACRHAWMDDRRRLFSGPVELAAPVEVLAPVEVAAPASVSVALPCSAPASASLVRVVYLPALHNDTAAFVWLSDYWRVPFALAVALLLILVSW
jgi:hypothetical protein